MNDYLCNNLYVYLYRCVCVCVYRYTYTYRYTVDIDIDVPRDGWYKWASGAKPPLIFCNTHEKIIKFMKILVDFGATRAATAPNNHKNAVYISKWADFLKQTLLIEFQY